MNSFSFCLFEEVFILPSFLKTALLDLVSLMGIFLFVLIRHFEYIILFSSGLQSFCWEFHLQFYRGSLVCDKSIFSCLFQNSFCVFDIWQFADSVS